MPYRHQLPLMVAMDKHRCIGKEGKIPFDLLDDRIHFRDMTVGSFKLTGKKNFVLVGRKTFDLLPPKYKPLPDRINLILSHRPLNEIYEDCKVIRDIYYPMEIARTHDVFICGGAEVYSLFLPYVSRMIVTHVNTVVEGGDTFFPTIHSGEWKMKTLAEFQKNEKNEFDFHIAEYTRRPPRRPHF